MKGDFTMKCERCGKNEVSVYLTSNINGNVTEKNLCADCAHVLGVRTGAGSFGPDLFNSFFGGSLLPQRQRSYGMSPGFGILFPAVLMPTQGIETSAEPKAAPCHTDIKVDAEVQKRREINMLREQMRQAAEAEDFEKAAQIRDSLKKLEQPPQDSAK